MPLYLVSSDFLSLGDVYCNGACQHRRAGVSLVQFSDATYFLPEDPYFSLKQKDLDVQKDLKIKNHWGLYFKALVLFSVLLTVTIHACALGRKEKKREVKYKSNWETRREEVFYSWMVHIKRRLQAKLFGIFYLTLISASRLMFSGQWWKK